MDGGFVVRCLELPGCVSEGETEEEAIANIADAMAGVISARMHENLRESLAHPRSKATARSRTERHLKIAVGL
ncbi:MAG TPA: type II toxin-antitoxin system HicB family antitoxin [Actinomycetota bacterium]|nr:type II toxin-antitoxin system HicB family antitoxin [Actinomycetota bacterium]